MKKGMFALFNPAFCDAFFAVRHFEISCVAMFYKKTIFASFQRWKLFSKLRKCSKKDCHQGKCDSKRIVKTQFWERSAIQVSHSIKREARHSAVEVEEECKRKRANLDQKEVRVSVRELEIMEKERQIQEVEEKNAAARIETGWDLTFILCYFNTS